MKNERSQKEHWPLTSNLINFQNVVQLVIILENLINDFFYNFIEITIGVLAVK